MGKGCNSGGVIGNGWDEGRDGFCCMGRGVGIGGGMVLGERWGVVEGVGGVIVSFFIVEVGVKEVKGCIDEVLEGWLGDDIEEEIRERVL